MSAPVATGPQVAILRFAIRFRGVLIALALLALGYGVYTVGTTTYDVFPEFAPPQVAIQTEAPGLSSEQVETLVTSRVEAAVIGAPGIETLRSASIQGLSLVTVIFDASADIYRYRQALAERLATLEGVLPAGVRIPAMTPLTSSSSTVLAAGLTSDRLAPMDLRTLADTTVRQRLLAVPGVAKVAVFGTGARSLRILVHPEQLVRFDLDLDDVLFAAAEATGIRGSGFIDTPNQRIVLEAVSETPTPDQIAATVLARHDGANVTIGTVADVVEAPEPPVGGASIDGKAGIMLMISEQYGSDTRAVTARIEEALDDLRPGLERDGVVVHADLFRPASFIDRATRNVSTSLLLGGALVVVVLFLFLFDLRTAAISIVAIPLSLLAAIIGLDFLGISLNAMTLGGLAMAIGEVVDDAVIDVENIARRLRENRQLATPQPVASVVLGACLEVRGAVVYATFAVVLVFLPVLALPGIGGRLFAPLAAAYILAVLASLAVALTVTPALSMALLSRGGRLAPPPLVRWSRRGYEALLRRIVGHPLPLIGITIALTVLGLTVLPGFGGSLIPELREGHFVVHMAAVPGSSIDESLRLGRVLNAELKEIPEVRLVAQRIGRAEAADDVLGTHYSEFEVDLVPLDGAGTAAVLDRIRQTLAGIPGATFGVNTFLTERVEETLSGAVAPVVVRVFGNDLAMLDGKAIEIARLLKAIRGSADVQLQSPLGVPQLSIALRPDDLARWGFEAVDVLDQIRLAYQGDIVGQGFRDGVAFNVAIGLAEEAGGVAQVGDLPLRAEDGVFVPLRQVADIRQTSGRFQVSHQRGQRLQTVTANVVGRDVASFAAEAESRLAAIELPPGAYLELSGEAAARSEAQDALLRNAAVAGVGILLLLAVITRNWRNLLLVVVNLPFALIGGVAAIYLTDGIVSLGSMVGFVTLFGITLRNSIMMVSHYEHLAVVEGVSWGRDTAIRGAADRLVPIIMTSLVTALGLLPLALGADDPGREVEGPMAIVILGGLLSSMALNLLLLPALALRFGRFKRTEDAFADMPPQPAS